MKPRPFARVLLPVLIISFVLGILSVMVFDAPGTADRSSASSRSTSTTINPAPSSNSNHTTVLVLGVDQLQSPSPRLLAVWWATINSFEDDIQLLGLPTNAFSTDESRALHEIFELNQDRSPSQDFLNALYSLSPHYPDVVLVLDEEAFARLVDFMGGAVLGGDTFSGHTLVSSLRFIRDDPELHLRIQATLLYSLGHQSAQLGENLEITSLTALVPEHAYTSIPPTTLVNLLIPALPFNPNDLQIEVWQSDSPDS